MVLVCGAILVLAFVSEWTSRTAALHNAEADDANLAKSLIRHADDTFELADSLVIGVITRLEADGDGPASIARLQKAIDVRKLVTGRVRGLFVYDSAGRWLATSAKVDNLAAHRQLRDGDLIARYGGEEFCALSRDADETEGMRIAERVRAAMAALSIDLDGRRLKITVSTGLALLDGDLLAATRCADMALYEAKALGRDKVCLASGVAPTMRRSRGPTHGRWALRTPDKSWRRRPPA
jgi:hypothetical protein